MNTEETNSEQNTKTNLERDKAIRKIWSLVKFLVFINVFTTALLAFFSNFGYSLSFLSFFSFLDSFPFYIWSLFCINVVIIFRIGYYYLYIDIEADWFVGIIFFWILWFFVLVCTQNNIFWDWRISIESKANEIVKEYSAIYQEQKDKKVLTETVIEKLEKIKNWIVDKEKRDEIENKINEYKSSIWEE